MKCSLLKISLLVALALTATESFSSEIVVYTYDSFASKSSMGRWLANQFEMQTGTKVKLVSFDNVGAAINQLKLEGASTKADLIAGIDNSMIPRLNEVALEDLPKSLKQKVPAVLSEGLPATLIPFNFGYLAFVYDSSRTKAPDSTTLLEFLQSKGLDRKLVIEDPRTSSIGFSFLVWTFSQFEPAQTEAIWKLLKTKTKTISPSWSGAYSLFSKKEVDYVLSYTTSPAYHRKESEKSTERALVFKDGHFRQVETFGISKFSKHKKLAIKFIEFALSEKAQAQIPDHNWMLPVMAGVALPDYFSVVPTVKSILISMDEVNKNHKTWLNQWRTWMVQ